MNNFSATVLYQGQVHFGRIESRSNLTTAIAKMISYGYRRDEIEVMEFVNGHATLHDSNEFMPRPRRNRAHKPEQNRHYWWED